MSTTDTEQPRPTVLVVESNPDSLAEIRASLAGDFVMWPASTAWEAQRTWSEAPHLLVAVVNLDLSSGGETASREVGLDLLRELAQRDGAVVVGLSEANGEVEREARVRGAHFLPRADLKDTLLPCLLGLLRAQNEQDSSTL